MNDMSTRVRTTKNYKFINSDTTIKLIRAFKIVTSLNLNVKVSVKLYTWAIRESNPTFQPR